MGYKCQAAKCDFGMGIAVSVTMLTPEQAKEEAIKIIGK